MDFRVHVLTRLAAIERRIGIESINTSQPQPDAGIQEAISGSDGSLANSGRHENIDKREIGYQREERPIDNENDEALPDLGPALGALMLELNVTEATSPVWAPDVVEALWLS